MTDTSRAIGEEPAPTGGVHLRRPPAMALAAAFVCGLSAWASAGVLAVVSPSASLRVGALPAWWAPLLVTTVVLAAALFLPIPRRAWPTLFFPALSLLPWLPVPVPAAFLLWTGPIVAWLWVATGLAFLVAARPWGERHDAPREPTPHASLAFVARAACVNPRWAPVLAFSIAFLLYCAAAWTLSPLLPGGDEPHYLVITQSILHDGDLRIENNHQQGDYRAFFPGVLRPDYLARARDGAIYSVHAPGLPALIAPAFALGGYPAVVVFLALVAALGGALLWTLAFVLTGSAGAAWFGWAAICLSTSFFFHAFQVFPDATGAVLTLVGLTALVKLEVRAGELPRPWLLAACGASLGLLPWLHTRYAVIAAIVGLAIAWRLMSRRATKSLAAFASLPALSAAAWFGFFLVVYGRFSPTAPYGGYTQSALGNIPRGLAGLFFDQQFGLLPYAPVYGLAVAGVVALGRRFPRLAVELALTVAAYLSVTAMYHMWWGGHSVAARFAVPALLMLGLPAAAWWAWWPRLRGVGVAALASSLLVTLSLALTHGGQLIFNDRDGFARWLAWLAPSVDLPTALPTLFRGSRWSLALQCTVWVMVGATCVWAVRRFAASDERDDGARLVTGLPWVWAVSVMCGVTGGWAVATWSGPAILQALGVETGRVASVPVQPVAASASQMEWLKRFHPTSRPIGVALGAGGSIMRSERLLPRLAIGVQDDRPLPPAPALLALTDVPAGTYRVVPAAGGTVQGTLRATMGRQADVVATWPLSGAAGTLGGLLLRLPAGVGSLSIAADEAAVGSVRAVALVPVSVLPVEPVASLRARRAFLYQAAAVYAFDDNVYLEPGGLWVKGGVHALIAISPSAPGPTCRVLVRNGASPNTVHLQSGSWQASFGLEPRAERTLDVPVDASRGGALLTVWSEGGFTPARTERGSGDRRFLGVWLEALR